MTCNYLAVNHYAFARPFETIFTKASEAVLSPWSQADVTDCLCQDLIVS
jgi:hypothetical protein